MAKKTFKELKEGDVIYYLNSKDGLTVNELTITDYVHHYYNGKLSYITFSFDDLKKDISRWHYSNDGLYFTTKEDAIDAQRQIAEGNSFDSLHVGDKIYAISSEVDDVIELTIRNKSFENDRFGIHDFNFLVLSFCGGSIKISIDRIFLNKLNGSDCINIGIRKDDKYMHSKNTTIFTRKEDAIKNFNERKRKRALSALKKVKKQINSFGQELVLKDNKGNTLHVGDTVAYVRRNGIYGHTDISIGIVQGESKTTINVFDQEECVNGKVEHRWRGGMTESDGIHRISQKNVMKITLMMH